MWCQRRRAYWAGHSRITIFKSIPATPYDGKTPTRKIRRSATGENGLYAVATVVSHLLVQIRLASFAETSVSSSKSST